MIVGATSGVYVKSGGTWKWYDGYIYGKTSTGNYNSGPNDTPTGYTPVTVSDTTYVTGGYRSYLASEADRIYEISLNGVIREYTNSLTTAFANVPAGGMIKALKNNTSNATATNTKNNVTLNTNGKTITLNQSIINSSDVALTVNGGGTLTTSSALSNIWNYGTLTTSSVNMTNVATSSHGYYVIRNYNNYDANQGTNITSNLASGIISYGGTTNLKNNVNVSSPGNTLVVPSGAGGNTTINITGANLTSISTQTISLNASSYTTTLNISSGSIIAGNSSNANYALYATSAGVKNITITGGTIRGYGDYGIYLNNANATLTIGTKDTNTPLTSPVIIGATYGVGGVDNSTINWYDGYIYGTTHTGNYNRAPSDTPTSYAPVTVSDTTYASGGYRSYLYKTSEKVYELSDSSGTITGYYYTLVDSFANVPAGGTIKTLVNNTSNTSITTTQNATLNTNGKTITLNAKITNASGKTLTINGGGIITTSSGFNMIYSYGSLTTTSVTIRNTTSTSFGSYVIANQGTYTANAGTVISSSSGCGIISYIGTVNLGSNVTISAYSNTLVVPSGASGNSTISITGANLTSIATQTISLNANAHTTSLSMSSGSIIAGDASHAQPALYTAGSGVKNVTVTGGFLKGDYNNGGGICINSANVTLVIGTKDSIVVDSPTIIGGTYAVATNASATWKWYDGYLYGKTSTGNYNRDPSDKPNGYTPTTISDTTYATGGYRTYLPGDEAKVYEIQNSSGSVTGYADTLASAFTSVAASGKIVTLRNNTVSAKATNTKNNVTLNTNGKTITLAVTDAITNNSSNALTINGGGTIKATTSIHMISNSGTLTTTSVTLANQYSASTGGYIIRNYNGTYNANASTNITSSSGYGIASFKGTINLGTGVIINTYKYPVAIGSNATGNTTTNITGAVITSSSTEAISVNASAYTTTVSISSGSIISSATYGIYLGSAGTKTLNVTGGLVRSTTGYGIYGTGSSVTINIGNNNGSVNATNPKIVGSTHAIRTDSSAKWYWYDGSLYGTNSGNQYYNDYTSLASGYGVQKTSDTTYATGGYRQYLITYTVTYQKGSGSGVNTLGATSGNCAPSSGSCSVTLPTFTLNSGYSAVGCSTSSSYSDSYSYTVHKRGTNYTLTSNTTLYALAVPTEACMYISSACYECESIWAEVYSRLAGNCVWYLNNGGSYDDYLMCTSEAENGATQAVASCQQQACSPINICE